MTQIVEEPLDAGRAAVARRAWREAFELLSGADGKADFNAEDLQALGDASYWTGHLDDALDAYERAYTAYLEAEDPRRAGALAVLLSTLYSAKLARSISAGWLGRAEHLLEDLPEGPEHGQLALRRFFEAFGQGDLDTAYELAQRAADIGQRLKDRDVEAMGTHQQGLVLIRKGEPAKGLALIDEASAAAVGGDLETFTTALLYCSTISACRDMTDYRRSTELIDTMKRWCDREAITGMPGVCRVHRGEVMRMKGDWSEAEQEVKRAVEELQGYNAWVVADGMYELGEIRRRVGDLPAAKEAFRQAHEYGHSAQPGLALVQFEEGNVEGASKAIKRALAEAGQDPFERARLLPSQVTLAIAAGDLERAEEAAGQLREVADLFATPALEASAEGAYGELSLAKGDAEGAVGHLRKAWRLWQQELGAPYEAATVRLLLARAYRADGDDEAALLEAEAARSVFERLGALPDHRRAIEFLGKEAVADGRAKKGARVERTFMFTDIVKSTDVLELVGDEYWENALRWHDETLQTLFRAYGAEEVKQVGDGFFVAFPDAGAAIECAVTIQRRLDEHRRKGSLFPAVRVGLHRAEATRRGRDYGGKGVHMAARIGAVAEGGEVVASDAALDGQAARFPVSDPRTVTLKGISQPVQVRSIDWR
ncbi:MAG TPA: adenylate/guanylate cyclase domain-containing protein [Gaiellaceae bacterium]|nr:adenylate/guanylate cyclase domain-containing protein [Gaiellaceae bacterium]